MKKYQTFAFISLLFALLTTHLACIIITREFTYNLVSAQYGAVSAPASTALLWLIPFGFITLFFGAITLTYYKKFKVLSAEKIADEKTRRESLEEEISSLRLQLEQLNSQKTDDSSNDI